MRGSSLAVVYGNPAVSYTCGGDMKYARATTSTGSSATDWSLKLVVTSGVGSLDTNLASIDGNPAIGYCGWTGPDSYALMYIRSTTNTGNAIEDWISPLTIDDSDQYVGATSDLAFVSGRPALAYGDGSTRALKFAHSVTSTGHDQEDWTQIETLQNDGSTGSGYSIAVVNGNPAISYHCNLDLMYACYQP